MLHRTKNDILALSSCFQLHAVRDQEVQCDQWSGLQYLDVGAVDLSQEDLLRLQAAQFTQLFLQPCVLFIHVQPQAIAHGCGSIQFNDYQNITQGSGFVTERKLSIFVPVLLCPHL